MIDAGGLYSVVWCVETSVRGEDKWLLVADTDEKKNCFASEQEACEALDAFVDKDAPASVRIYRATRYRKALSSLGAYFLALDEGGNFEVDYDDDEGVALVREAIELWRAHQSDSHPYPQSECLAVRGGNGESSDRRPPVLWPYAIRYLPMLAQIADELWRLGLDEEFDGAPAVTMLSLPWRHGIPQYALCAGDEVISHESLSAQDILDLLHDLSEEGKDRAEIYAAFKRALSCGAK